ncbi:MAG: hypothetical protein J5517_00330 [Eubacterium sp.]|nr:hypothetical protein [Eubacterium sp.]
MKTFSRHINKVIACLVFLGMMIGIFMITTVNAAQDLDAQIRVSYEFQEDFDMIFNCKIYSKGDFKNVRLSVNFDGKTIEITEPEFYDKDTGLYRFVFREVSAAEMSSVAKATLVANIGNEEYRSQVVETSIKEYAMALLNYYGSPSDSNIRKQCTALVDMLNYGAAAQTYFGKNTGNLANKDLTSAQKKLGSTLPSSASSCYKKSDISNPAAVIQKIALDFENPVDLVVYSSFNSTPSSKVEAVVSYKDADEVTKTIKVPSSKFEKKEEDGLYRVEFKDIPVDCLTTKLSIVFKESNKAISATVTYSCESYAKAILEGDYKDNVKDLVKKMLVYGKAAEEYGKTLPTDCVTYRQFGAMGTGVKEVTEGGKTVTRGVDDYYAFVMTHDYANKNGLPVKADKGAHYYAREMNPNTPYGAEIRTETDWGKAEFTIDDTDMYYTLIKDTKGNIIGYDVPQAKCYLFTVMPSKRSQYKYINGDKYGVYLGLDPKLFEEGYYPEYDGTPECSKPNLLDDLKNKTLSKEKSYTGVIPERRLEGYFTETALYHLRSSAFKRWGRSFSGGTNKPRDQEEIIIVKKSEPGTNYGVVDSSTPVEWDWKDIHSIKKYTIDEDLLTVEGGTFTTIVNYDVFRNYLWRGLGIIRSNVLVKNVQHLHAGEDKKFTSESATKASRGAPYSGFFRLDHCAYVTLKDCGFTDHMNVSDGTYDYYAEYAAAITIDHCVCLPDKEDDSTLVDERTWGTTGTNYCKTFSVINHSKLSRVDGHMGVYNITVKDSTLGDKSVAAVGFGTMYLENVKSYGGHLVNLRRDYGSAWFGDIVIKNCTWDIRTNYSTSVIDITYDPTVEYGYDEIVKNGKKYYSQMPDNITIDGLTVDASHLAPKTYKEDGTLATQPGQVFYNRGLNLFSQVIFETPEVNENYLSNPQPSYEVYCQQQQDYLDQKTTESAAKKYKYPYYFPIRGPERINVHGIHIISRKDYEKSRINGIFMRCTLSSQAQNFKDTYFFSKSYDKPYFNVTDDPQFNYSNEVTYEIAD